MNWENLERIAEGVFLFRETGLGMPALYHTEKVIGLAPLRQLTVPGGRLMSVHITNCGDLGWTSDRTGYRYSPVDPLTGEPWPQMPTYLETLATIATDLTCGECFRPDACLINRYAPGTQMGMHRDTDEADHSHPIVSVSLGLTATFALGGLERGGPTQAIELHHGDVLVMSGEGRRRYHGVRKVKDAECWPHRTNLTFRRAG